MKKRVADMNSLKIIAAIAIVLLCAFVVVYYWQVVATIPPNGASLNREFEVTQISITQQNATSDYYAYLALNQSQQQLGYMNQTSLGNCNGHSPCIGMLFLFSGENTYCFWMKNTEIPLEQIWFNTNTETHVYTGQPYSTATACYPGFAVLETSPGFAIAPNATLRVNVT